MKARIVGVVLATVMVLGLTAGTASAKQPQAVDCDLLAATNVAVDAFLDANNVEFNNLGDLVSTGILDDAAFNELNDLQTLVSGGEIRFDNASQALSTNAKCGLAPGLIAEIRD